MVFRGFFAFFSKFISKKLKEQDVIRNYSRNASKKASVGRLLISKIETGESGGSQQTLLLMNQESQLYILEQMKAEK